jgi:hypothetical protein
MLGRCSGLGKPRRRAPLTAPEPLRVGVGAQQLLGGCRHGGLQVLGVGGVGRRLVGGVGGGQRAQVAAQVAAQLRHVNVAAVLALDHLAAAGVHVQHLRPAGAAAGAGELPGAAARDALAGVAPAAGLTLLTLSPTRPLRRRPWRSS